MVEQLGQCHAIDTPEFPTVGLLRRRETSMCLLGVQLGAAPIKDVHPSRNFPISSRKTIRVKRQHHRRALRRAKGRRCAHFAILPQQRMQSLKRPAYPLLRHRYLRCRVKLLPGVMLLLVPLHPPSSMCKLRIFEARTGKNGVQSQKLV